MKHTVDHGSRGARTVYYVMLYIAIAYERARQPGKTFESVPFSYAQTVTDHVANFIQTHR